MRFEKALECIVVLCAGRAERFAGEAKCLSPAAGAPLLAHAIAPFRPFCKKWIFVSSPGDIALKEFILGEDIPAEIAVQPDPIGMTDAVLRGAALAGKRFVLLLGDCIIRGTFRSNAESGVAAGVWPGASAADISANYGVRTHGGAITGAIEKPRDTAGLLCGMGIYFLTTDFCAFLARENEARGGALHFTSALDMWARSDRGLAALPFEGFYRNVNTPEDLAAADDFLRRQKA